MMRYVVTLLAAFAVTTGAFAPVAVAQNNDDDWEFAEDASRNLTVAAVRYAAGNSIVAQCAGEVLKIAIIGLPATTQSARRFDLTRSDGATDTSSWQVIGGQTLVSGTPARDARFLRVGGELRIRSASGQDSPISASFDLPAQHGNLDRVLASCGYAVEDDRDTIPRADPSLRLRRHSSEGESGGQPGSSVELSCLVEDGAYQECRADHAPKGETAAGAMQEASRRNGYRVHPDDAAANEGHVVYINVPLLLVVQG